MRAQLDRILICRTDNIGDVVLTLPLAGYLKSRFPQAQVELLCRAYVAPAMRHCRFLDRVVAVEEAAGGATELEAFFAAGGYDTVIFAYPDRRLAKAARRARVPNRVGTSHRVYHWFTCNKLAHFSRVKSDLHEAQLNFALLRPLGIDVLPTLAEIPPLYGLTAPRDPAVDALLTPARRHVILHPKSNGNGREWPLDHYTALARELASNPEIRLFVTGSAAEGTLIARDAPDLLALPNVSNLCGSLSLDGLVALIGACDGLVASGTGPLHLSAALGRPTLGLFPPIKPIDPARWGALGTQAEVLVAPQPCAACADPAACNCMRAITPQAVAARVRAWCAGN
jgi:ADP-heptose:LPS heptosyltransferase